MFFLMDNLLFWNIRGLNEPQKQFTVKKIQKENKCSLIGIVETRVGDINKFSVLAGLGDFECVDNYSFSHKGRI